MSDTSKIEEKITSKTKAIMPVSLYGQPADMEGIQAIANKHGLKVIVDGAQSFSSTFNGKTDSNLGDISTTSFFLAKPLGCFGDGGAVFTNDDVLAIKMKSFRVHGQSKGYHHQYSVRVQNRDDVQAKLKKQGIPTAVHYPMPLHLQEAFAYLGYNKGDFAISEIVSNEIMSLPMNPYLMDEEILYIERVL